MKRSLPEDFAPREMCGRCRRPERVCFCRHLPSLETKTRVVLLQHPRERDMAIGTAHMASLCLVGSELHVGVDFADSAAVDRILSDAERPAALLWPGEGAIDVVQHPPQHPITLVVVDGTWWQAKKLVRMNPRIAALPRYAFVPPAPSEYRIRREPQPSFVSTIEALVHVLGALEDDPERYQALLVPFRAMIDAQIDFATNVRGSRGRHSKGPKPPPRPRFPPVLVNGRERVVCVTAESNAWPYRDRDLRTSYREELVHWVAYRLGTGETLDVVVAPRMPLAPSTPVHIRVPEDALTGGASLDELHAAWRSFVREDDVLCSWGAHGTSVFENAGGTLPKERIDLRAIARSFGRGPVGSMESFLTRIASAENDAHAARRAPIGRGRAGMRAAQLADVADAIAGSLNDARWTRRGDRSREPRSPEPSSPTAEPPEQR